MASWHKDKIYRRHRKLTETPGGQKDPNVSLGVTYWHSFTPDTSWLQSCHSHTPWYPPLYVSICVSFCVLACWHMQKSLRSCRVKYNMYTKDSGLPESSCTVYCESHHYASFLKPRGPVSIPYSRPAAYPSVLPVGLQLPKTQGLQSKTTGDWNPRLEHPARPLRSAEGQPGRIS